MHNLSISDLNSIQFDEKLPGSCWSMWRTGA